MGINREYHSLNQAEAQIRWCGCNLLVRAATLSSDEVRAVPSLYQLAQTGKKALTLTEDEAQWESGLENGRLSSATVGALESSSDWPMRHHPHDLTHRRIGRIRQHVPPRNTHYSMRRLSAIPSALKVFPRSSGALTGHE